MSHMIVHAGWASDIGKVRRENQDAVVFLPEDGLFAVADGMGGLPCGKKAAELACSLLQEYLAPLKMCIRDRFRTGICTGWSAPLKTRPSAHGNMSPPTRRRHR